MPKEEWGVKRLCPTTGKRFYDLGKDPIVSPYTGEVVTLVTGKSHLAVAAKEKQPKDVVEDDADELLVDDDDDSDVDLGDDVLEDDDEEDVSLDEIADVAAPDDDS